MGGIEILLSALCLNSTCNQTAMTSSNNIFDESLELNSISSTVKAFALTKLKQEISGQKLRVVCLEDYPLSYTRIINGTRVGMGVAFQLLEFLTEKFNFTYEIVLSEKNVVGSTKDMEGSILKMLQDGKADFVASFIPILADARKYILYSTTSLDEGEWIMIMLRPTDSSNGSGLLAPFDNAVWMLILLSLLAVGPIIYLLIIIRFKLTKDNSQKTYPLPHCVWFVYGALMKQGSTLSPLSDSTRLLFATWWIFITILTSFYTANLTAFLTLSKFILPINNVGELLKKEKNFVAHRGGGVEYAIKNTDESLTQLSKMVEKNLAVFTESLNDSDVLINYVEKKNFVFVRDKPAIDHMIYNDYKHRKTINMIDEKFQCPFAVSTVSFMKRRRAFAYPRDTKLNVLFDPELLYLVEAGMVKYMLMEGLPNTQICPQNLGSTERQLRNGDLMMTYYVMITGFCTASVVFLTEMIFKCLNGRIKTSRKPVDNTTNNLNEKNKFMPSISPPPPYATLFTKNRNLFFNNNINTLSSQNDVFGVKKNINGRDYMVITGADGESRLIPLRTPSAALFQYSYTK